MRPVDTAASMGSEARSGLTLLEVLIACGLLIIGLSTMAALLPAAGFRLAQAQLEDRASVLAANALAEVTNRRLITASSFPSGRTSTLAFGAVIGTLPSFGLLPTGTSAGFYFVSPPQAMQDGFCSPRTFLLEDELLYTAPGDNALLANSFTSQLLGTGPRSCKASVCWGATLTSATTSLAALTIAIFKPGAESRVPIPVVLTSTNGFYEADITPTGSLLRACRWILAIPPMNQALAPQYTQWPQPKWFQIMSSWTLPPPAPQTTRVIVQDSDDGQSFESVTGANANGAKATVLAFDGLIRVDHHLLPLQ